MNGAVAERDRPRLSSGALLALMAVAALVTRVLVYVLDRPAVTVYFLPQSLSLPHGHRPWFGALGNYLPEFTHVYAFILLTMAVSPWPRRVLPICAFWCVAASLAEFGQHPALAPAIAAAPQWLQQVPILENTANYVLYGTFDPWDLVAVAIGTVSAYVAV